MTRGPSKQFDRDEVLDRAMELFWANGYEATGMTTLLDHMGIGRQSLYDTFGDKRSLFLEALSRYYQTRVGPMIGQLHAPGSGLENMKRVFGMWQQLSASSDFHGCLVGNTVAEFGRVDPELGKILHGYLSELEDAFHHALTRAKEDGEIEPVVPLRDLATMLVNTGQGLALLAQVHPDSSRLGRVARATMAMIGAR